MGSIQRIARSEKITVKIIPLALSVALLFSAPYTEAFDNTTSSTTSNGFMDVGVTAWYHDSIMRVVNDGLMVGIDKDYFAPEKELARAEFAVILYRFAGCPKLGADVHFDDVLSDIWYSEAVYWAVDSGYMDATDGKNFQPLNTITREQAAMSLWNYIYYYDGLYNLQTPYNLQDYYDYDDISSSAKYAVSMIVGNGIMQGSAARRFSPLKSLTRAEAAVIFDRFIDFFNYDPGLL